MADPPSRGGISTVSPVIRDGDVGAWAGAGVAGRHLAEPRTPAPEPVASTVMCVDAPCLASVIFGLSAGSFDRTCVRPLDVAFVVPRAGHAVRKAGPTSALESCRARAPGLGVPALNARVRVAYSSSIARPGRGSPCRVLASWEARITPSGDPASSRSWPRSCGPLAACSNRWRCTAHCSRARRPRPSWACAPRGWPASGSGGRPSARPSGSRSWRPRSAVVGCRSGPSCSTAPSLALPPVGRCRGTRPSRAARLPALEGGHVRREGGDGARRDRADPGHRAQAAQLRVRLRRRTQIGGQSLDDLGQPGDLLEVERTHLAGRGRQIDLGLGKSVFEHLEAGRPLGPPPARTRPDAPASRVDELRALAHEAPAGAERPPIRAPSVRARSATRGPASRRSGPP